MSVGGYDGMHLIYEALKKTGGKTDGDSLIAAMKGMKWESPRGPISIDPDTRDIVQNIYIRKVEKIERRALQRRVRDLRGRQGPGEGGEEVAVAQPLHPVIPDRPRLRRHRVVRRDRAAIPTRRARRPATSADTPPPQRGRGTTRSGEFMLTILFDGIAYGMLLFVLACGLAVTLGLMNFVNLAHGAFAMAGGYITVILVNRLGRAVPRRRCRSRSCSPPSLGVAARAHALCARLRQEPSRPGAVHHRPRVHVGRGGRLRDGLAAAVRARSRPTCRARSTSSASASAAIGC